MNSYNIYYIIDTRVNWVIWKKLLEIKIETSLWLHQGFFDKKLKIVEFTQSDIFSWYSIYLGIVGFFGFNIYYNIDDDSCNVFGEKILWKFTFKDLNLNVFPNMFKSKTKPTSSMKIICCDKSYAVRI